VTDDELREQLALYAVGALDADERAELEEVLRARPDLRAELDELLEAAALLADAEQEAPPATLRAGVLDRIAAEPQLPAALPRTSEPVAPVVPIGSGRRRNRWIAAGAGLVAAAAIAVGVLVVTSPWDDDGDTDPVAAVVDADDAQTIAMPGNPDAGDLALPGVTIVHSAEQDASVILADAVPIPEGNDVYVLWAIRDGTPEAYAPFRPNADGTLSVYAAGLDPASAEAWAITQEATPNPTTPSQPILNITA
jgi:anti-sigma-K factor RskA